MTTSFHEDALKMRERLNQVSPCMCLAKWLQTSLHLTNGTTHSCYHPRPHKVSKSRIKKDPSALHNTAFKKKQRRKMLQGKRPSECKVCWSIEDTPGDHLSDRPYRSAETWSAPHFGEVLKAGAKESINPRSVEVQFSSACQMKCSYCSPHISSSWMEEIREKGGYRLRSVEHNTWIHFWLKRLLPIPAGKPNPYVDAFWKWWPDLYQDLEVFRMTGGEPLLDPNTFRVFEYVLQNPKPGLSLAVTSNFSVRDELIERFITKTRQLVLQNSVGQFQLYVSCDTVGAQAEYIRFGLRYDQFIRNVENFLSRVPSASVTFIVTFNNLSLSGWPRLIETILALRSRFGAERVLFDTPLLREPRWQSLQILTDDFQARFAEQIENLEARLHDYEVARLRRNLSWMRQPLAENQLRSSRADFFAFFREHDRRRGTDFLKTFPELEAFWRVCEKAYSG